MSNIAVKILKLLREIYFDETNIGKFENILMKHIQNNDFHNKKDYEIANIIYDIINETIHDKHISFSPNTKQDSKKHTATFYKKLYYVKIIKNDIGYIKFDEFIDFGLNKLSKQKDFDELSRRKMNIVFSIINTAFNKIKQCKYIIFDLRNNHGGCEQIVKLMLSYILHKKTLLNKLYYKNHIRKIVTYDLQQLQEMSGVTNIPTLYNNDIVVLVSKNTFSAGEEFAYDLQSLKRATIIGEKTGGGANGGDYFIVNKYMKMFIPFYKTVNNITRTNWNNIGVIPDIVCPSTNALTCALKHIKKL